jgi:hypothetical protein
MRLKRVGNGYPDALALNICRDNNAVPAVDDRARETLEKRYFAGPQDESTSLILKAKASSEVDVNTEGDDENIAFRKLCVLSIKKLVVAQVCLKPRTYMPR